MKTYELSMVHIEACPEKDTIYIETDNDRENNISVSITREKSGKVVVIIAENWNHNTKTLILGETEEDEE